MNRTLTVDGYHRARFADRSVEAWLKDNGLEGAWIFRAQFGEGVLHARCYGRDDEGHRYMIDCGDGLRMIANHLLDIPLRTAPPAVLYDVLEDVPL